MWGHSGFLADEGFGQDVIIEISDCRLENGLLQGKAVLTCPKEEKEEEEDEEEEEEESPL